MSFLVFILPKYSCISWPRIILASLFDLFLHLPETSLFAVISAALWNSLVLWSVVDCRLGILTHTKSEDASWLIGEDGICVLLKCYCWCQQLDIISNVSHFHYFGSGFISISSVHIFWHLCLSEISQLTPVTQNMREKKHAFRVQSKLMKLKAKQQIVNS